jgi:hypothetical protein
MTYQADDGPLAGLPNLGRRMSRKIETRRGLQLSPADLDLFVLSGAYEAFSNAVAAYQKAQCDERLLASQSTKTGERIYSGKQETAEQAIARARQAADRLSPSQAKAYIAALSKNA